MSGGKGGDGAGGGVADSKKLFEGVRFAINDSLAPRVRQQLTKLLTERGGIAVEPRAQPVAATLTSSATASSSTSTPYEPSQLTHYITDTLQFTSYIALRPNKEFAPYPRGYGTADRVEIVTPFWVTKSYDLQVLQGTSYFSADRALLFSGFTFCTSELPEGDVLAIEAGGRSLGAQFRKELTREVTHLFVVAPRGAKYQAGIKFGAAVGMTVLLPHWFDECLKLCQLVPTAPFEFPEPPLFNISNYTDPSKTAEEKAAEATKKTAAGTGANESPSESKASEDTTMTAQILGGATRAAVLFGPPGRPYPLLGAGREKERESLHRTGAINRILPPGLSNPTPPSGRDPLSTNELAECTEQIFAGRRVYLAGDLGLREGLEAALKTRIEAAGGKCWSWRLDGEGDRSGRFDQSSSSPGVGLNRRGSSLTKAPDHWERRRIAEAELARSNLVVTRVREGWEYWTAFDQKKMIGNLAWVYHVLATARLASPLDRLVHYPTPPEPVPAFDSLRITISNYSGPARDYVRTLIEMLGAKFEGAMTKTTAYVVASSNFGAKYVHAKQWGIPIVTHLWLEACVLEWKLVNPVLAPQYQSFVIDNSQTFSAVLGDAPLPQATIDKWAQLPSSVAARQEALQKVGHEELLNEILDADDEAAMLVEREQQQRLSGKSRIPDEDEEVVMEVDHGGQQFGEAEDVAMLIDGADGPADEVDEPAPRPTKTKNAKASAVQSVTKPNAKGKGKTRAKAPKPASNEVEEEEEEDTKPDRQMDVDDDDEGDDSVVEEAEPVVNGGKSSRGAARRKRADPVAGPSKTGPSTPPAADRDGNSSSSSLSSTSTRDPPAAAKKSVRAGSKPIATRKPSRKKVTPTADRSESSEDESDAPHTPKHFADFENPIPAVGKRAAAGVAAARLKEQMPDAIKFAQELRSSTSKKRKRDSHGPGRSRSEKPKSESSDSEGETASPVAVVNGKGKGKAMTATGRSRPDKKARREAESEESDDGAPAPPVKAGASKKGRAKEIVAAATATGTVSSFDNPPHAPPPKKNASAPVVRILATGLALDSEAPDIKALCKLGAKWCDVPKDVTHLVAQNISRTEKFLSAIASAPKVVTKKWITDSVAAGKFLDETKYALKDTAKERELGHTLDSILKRARERKLFEGMTIYLTPKILPDVATLRRVISSAGGTVLTGTFDDPKTMRLIADEDDIFIVSCPKDRNRWDKISSTHKKPIYSVEAIFQSVLIQLTNFRDDFRIDLQLGQ